MQQLGYILTVFVFAYIVVLVCEAIHRRSNSAWVKYHYDAGYRWGSITPAATVQMYTDGLPYADPFARGARMAVNDRLIKELADLHEQCDNVLHFTQGHIKHGAKRH